MLAQLTINIIDRDGIVTVAPVTLEVENTVTEMVAEYGIHPRPWHR